MRHGFLKTVFLSGALIFTPPVLDKAFAQTSGHTPGGEDRTEQKVREKSDVNIDKPLVQYGDLGTVRTLALYHETIGIYVEGGA